MVCKLQVKECRTKDLFVVIKCHFIGDHFTAQIGLDAFLIQKKKVDKVLLYQGLMRYSPISNKLLGFPPFPCSKDTLAITIGYIAL
jgi:hypothetical protein